MLDNNKSIIDIKKAFVLFALIQIPALFLLATGNMFYLAAFGIAIVGLLVILFLPIEPMIGVPIMMAATGLNYLAAIVQSQETIYKLSSFHIIFGLTLASVLFSALLRGKTTLPSLPLWPPMVTYLGVISFSLIYTPLFLDGFMELFRLAALCILALIIIIAADKKWKIQLVTWSYVIIPAGVSLYTIHEIITGGEFYKAQVTKVATELGLNVYRSTGTFANPNDLACFIMIGIITSFGLLFLKNITNIGRLILILGIGLSSIGLITTFSRGGWLSTGIAIVFIMLAHRRWSYFFIFVGFLATVFVLIMITRPEILFAALTRFSTFFHLLSEDSSSSRVSLIKTGIWMWQDNPIFGVGAAGYAYYAIDYMDPNMPRILNNVVLPHTIQIKMLAEGGIVGFTIGCWLFFTILIDSIKPIKSIGDDFLKNTQIILAALFIAFWVNFTVSSDFHNNMYWMTVGMIYAVPLVWKKINKDSKTVSL